MRASSELPPPPPAEFVGKARLFRAGICEVDPTAEAAINRLNMLTCVQAGKGTVPRGLAGFWKRQVPTIGQLSLAIDESRRGVRIEELRLSGAHYTDLAWEDDAKEPGLCCDSCFSVIGRCP